MLNNDITSVDSVLSGGDSLTTVQENPHLSWWWIGAYSGPRQLETSPGCVCSFCLRVAIYWGLCAWQQLLFSSAEGLSINLHFEISLLHSAFFTPSRAENAFSYAMITSRSTNLLWIRHIWSIFSAALLLLTIDKWQQLHWTEEEPNQKWFTVQFWTVSGLSVEQVSDACESLSYIIESNPFWYFRCFFFFFF